MKILQWTNYIADYNCRCKNIPNTKWTTVLKTGTYLLLMRNVLVMSQESLYPIINS